MTRSTLAKVSSLTSKEISAAMKELAKRNKQVRAL
jgi:predicted HTH domain antitoxin